MIALGLVVTAMGFYVAEADDAPGARGHGTRAVIPRAVRASGSCGTGFPI